METFASVWGTELDVRESGSGGGRDVNIWDATDTLRKVASRA